MKKLAAIALCLLSLTAGRAFAEENRKVRIINRSSSPIEYFYASNVDSASWEEDILGRGRVLLPGYYIDVNIDDGTGHCLFDLKAVLANGKKAETRKVNVCRESSWTVTD